MPAKNLKRYTYNGFQRRAPGAYRLNRGSQLTSESLAAILNSQEFIDMYGVVDVVAFDDNLAVTSNILMSGSLSVPPSSDFTVEQQQDNHLVVSDILFPSFGTLETPTDFLPLQQDDNLAVVTNILNF